MVAKRIFDLVFTIPGLILLTPVFIIIAIWIRLDSPGPVFFRQVRVGRQGKLFRIFKFRTMVVNAEQMGAQITVGEDRRITRSGKYLRKYKLDELPQLFNVLRGHMSLVGPRPEVPKYVEFYPPEIKNIVLSVPPGITDIASIEYRDESDILGRAKDPEKVYVEEILPVKLAYYLKYVRERNLLQDFLIVLRTFLAIARGSKANPTETGKMGIHG